MSTENTPDEPENADAIEPAEHDPSVDPTEVVEPAEIVDPTQVLDLAEVVEPTQVIESTEVIDLQADESNPEVDPTVVAAAASDDTRVIDEPAPGNTASAQEAREPHPFDLFTSAPTTPTPPVVVVEPPEPVRRRLRVGTVVWGLVLAACGLGVIACASGARIDFQLALILLLAVAGTVLLVGSILSGARHARR